MQYKCVSYQTIAKILFQIAVETQINLRLFVGISTLFSHKFFIRV